mmetsp:Transcript_17643/g.46995  ORF Transcript_17643/g.46995 Transcript_17643/m.46995 type:complete len:216 (-) Transcript_17643:537-1184(-)
MRNEHALQQLRGFPLFAAVFVRVRCACGRDLLDQVVVLGLVFAELLQAVPEHAHGHIVPSLGALTLHFFLGAITLHVLTLGLLGLGDVGGCLTFGIGRVVRSFVLCHGVLHKPLPCCDPGLDVAVELRVPSAQLVSAVILGTMVANKRCRVEGWRRHLDAVEELFRARQLALRSLVRVCSVRGCSAFFPVTHALLTATSTRHPCIVCLKRPRIIF